MLTFGEHRAKPSSLTLRWVTHIIYSGMPCPFIDCPTHLFAEFKPPERYTKEFRTKAIGKMSLSAPSTELVREVCMSYNYVTACWEMRDSNRYQAPLTHLTSPQSTVLFRRRPLTSSTYTALGLDLHITRIEIDHLTSLTNAILLLDCFHCLNFLVAPIPVLHTSLKFQHFRPIALLSDWLATTISPVPP
jgi:hypothetical protein